MEYRSLYRMKLIESYAKSWGEHSPGYMSAGTMNHHLFCRFRGSSDPLAPAEADDLLYVTSRAVYYGRKFGQERQVYADISQMADDGYYPEGYENRLGNGYRSYLAELARRELPVLSEILQRESERYDDREYCAEMV